MTLEDYPMEHGVAEARQRAREVRLQRSKVAEWMMSVREESESLRDYGRYRFQTAVEDRTVQERSGPGPLFDDARRRRPVTVSGYPSHPKTSRPPTNGPTRDGSVLYRTTPLVLSAIRTRPRSEPVSRFNHLRGTTEIHPSIQQTLMQSNCEYRLVTSSMPVDRDAVGQHPRAGRGTGFITFVPRTPLVEVTPTQEDRENTPPPRDEQENDTQLHEEKEEGLSEMGSYICNKEDLSAQEATMSDVRISSNVPDDESLEVKTRSSVDRTVHGKVGRSGRDHENLSTMRPNRDSGKKKSSKQNASAQLTSSQPATANLQSPEQARLPKGAPANQKRGTSSKGRLSLKSPPADAKSQPMSASPPTSSKSASSSSISTTSIIHHPHCWVDDISVSSDEPEVEMQILDIAGTLAPDSLLNVSTSLLKPKAASKGGLLTPSKLKITAIQKVEDSAPHGITNLEEQESERPPPSAQVMEKEEEEEEKEVVLTFPHFLCPSSERKSRQVATKEWLAKSPFSAAIKTVPLT